MEEFRHSFLVRAPLERVGRFHADLSVLSILTPPPMRVRIEPGSGFEVEEDMVARFSLRFGLLTIPWVARHIEVGPGGFTDVMEEGPLRTWVHRHSFLAVPRGIEVREHVRYEHDSGLRGLRSRLMFNDLALRGLFLYREWRTRQALES